MSAAPSIAASPSGSPAEHFSAELKELPSLDLHELRVRWRKLLRAPVPDLPRYLLVRLLAYKLQAKAFGDLDRDSIRYLDRIARDRDRQRTSGAGKRKPKAPPPIPPVPDGFSWQGRTYKSLSEIARLITGTRWNGPRFFGLREKTILAESRGGDP